MKNVHSLASFAIEWAHERLIAYCKMLMQIRIRIFAYSTIWGIHKILPELVAIDATNSFDRNLNTMNTVIVFTGKLLNYFEMSKYIFSIENFNIALSSFIYIRIYVYICVKYIEIYTWMFVFMHTHTYMYVCRYLRMQKFLIC